MLRWDACCLLIRRPVGIRICLLSQSRVHQRYKLAWHDCNYRPEMVWWWLCHISGGLAETNCWDLWLWSHVHVSKQEEIWQRLPSSAEALHMLVTLLWNSLMMTVHWAVTKQVECFIFMSDMSFHTLLNGKTGLSDLSFSVPAWLLPHRRKQAEFRLKCVKSEAVRFICNIRTIS